MPVEVNIKNLFLDFNPSKFIVYSCLLVFCLLFALRLDGAITWSYWIVFLPVWIWKLLVLSGSVVGSWVWWKHPHYRLEGESYSHYKGMVLCTGMHMLLLMFELLACDKLQNGRPQVLWLLVFIPLIFISIISIGVCVWSIKHERTFELELFCSVNILQFIFLALRLDGFIEWDWVVIFIPIWIVMCVALIGVLYAIVLAIILLNSTDIIPEQRRGNAFFAVGYTCWVIPLLVFEVLLVNKQDGLDSYKYIGVTLPLFVSLFTLVLMSFSSKGANQWWFGLRKEFCPWLLGVCPVLQEYGNISYKIQTDSNWDSDRRTTATPHSVAKKTAPHAKKGPTIEDSSRTVVPVVSIDVPD